MFKKAVQIKRLWAQPKPRYGRGDVIGKLLVEDYIDFTDRHPRTRRVMAKAQHWYTCSCSCGRGRTTINQQALSDSRLDRIKACSHCILDARRIQRAEQQSQTIKSFHEVEPETEETQT